jgi:hypothetical protein
MEMSVHLSRYSGGLRVGRPGFDSRQYKIFLFSTASRPTLGPPSLLSNGYLGAFSPGVKRQGDEADHSPPSSAEVKEGGAIPPLPHIHFIAFNETEMQGKIRRKNKVQKCLIMFRSKDVLSIVYSPNQL